MRKSFFYTPRIFLPPAFPMLTIKAKSPDSEEYPQQQQQQSRPCLCQDIKWIIRISQICAVVPLLLECRNNREENLSTVSISPKCTKTCQLRRKFLSIPFLGSILTLALFSHISCMSTAVDPVVKTMFKKTTDIYAFKIHTTFRITQTVIVALAGLLFHPHLIRGWERIQTVAADAHVYPAHLRRTSRAMAVGVTLMGLMNLLLSAWMGIRLCISQDGEGLTLFNRINCTDFGLTRYVLFIWTLAISEYTHLALSSFLFVLALAYKSLHQGIGKKLKGSLEKRNRPVVQFVQLKYEREEEERGGGAAEFERLRLLYESLCEVVVHLRGYFGVSALVVCWDGMLTCVFSMYWRIIYYDQKNNGTGGGGMDDDVYFVCVVSMHLIFSLYSLLLILVAGQIFSNSVSPLYCCMRNSQLMVQGLESPDAIRKSNLCHLKSSERFQITTLLQFSSGFPKKFSVFYITSLELPFLATATTNIITYILVLMQFRVDAQG